MTADTVWLKDLIREARAERGSARKLTDRQQLSLLALATKHCPEKTREVIRERIARPLTSWPGCWVIDRLYIEGDQVCYCTGQDYRVEMAELRKRLHAWR